MAVRGAGIYRNLQKVGRPSIAGRGTWKRAGEQDVRSRCWKKKKKEAAVVGSQPILSKWEKCLFTLLSNNNTQKHRSSAEL